MPDGDKTMCRPFCCHQYCIDDEELDVDLGVEMDVNVVTRSAKNVEDIDLSVSFEEWQRKLLLPRTAKPR